MTGPGPAQGRKVDGLMPTSSELWHGGPPSTYRSANNLSGLSGLNSGLNTHSGLHSSGYGNNSGLHGATTSVHSALSRYDAGGVGGGGSTMSSLSSHISGPLSLNMNSRSGGGGVGGLRGSTHSSGPDSGLGDRPLLQMVAPQRPVAVATALAGANAQHNSDGSRRDDRKNRSGVMIQLNPPPPPRRSRRTGSDQSSGIGSVVGSSNGTTGHGTSSSTTTGQSGSSTLKELCCGRSRGMFIGAALLLAVLLVVFVPLLIVRVMPAVKEMNRLERTTCKITNDCNPQPTSDNAGKVVTCTVTYDGYAADGTAMTFTGSFTDTYQNGDKIADQYIIGNTLSCLYDPEGDHTQVLFSRRLPNDRLAIVVAFPVIIVGLLCLTACYAMSRLQRCRKRCYDTCDPDSCCT